MATNFPTSLDSLNNPSSSDQLSGHAQQHSNANDAIEALQTKVGINSSTNTSSLDYRIAQLETGGGQLGVELGLAGNNDLTITGIENKTKIDEFSKTVYRTVNYELQITKGSEYYTSSIKVLNDGTNINLSESNIVSNTNNTLATVTFEENSGIIGLNVTPASTAVTARFYRTALKI